MTAARSVTTTPMSRARRIVGTRDGDAGREVVTDLRDEALGQQDADHQAEERADQADDHALDDHGGQHLSAARADRAEQRELPGSLVHDDLERVVDHEDADQQCDERRRSG